MYSTVFVAGYGNSESKHWQRLWFEQTLNAYWIEQEDWNHPDKELWIAALEKTMLHVELPVLFIAHSLGCHTVVEWAKKYHKDQNIIGALLVAPPDTAREDLPKDIIGFSNVPKETLAFKSLCVISSDDPYSSKERSEYLANLWGSRVVHVGKRGHINLASNLGAWEEGKKILKDFI
jgi:predicted alpha/beta hydrolase family esterase